MESTVQVHLPFSIREEQNGTPDHYRHSIVNQAPEQLGFISDIGSRANSLFSVVCMYVSTLVYTVQSTQEMHTRDCVLTGLRGHECGRKTGGVALAGDWSSRQCWSQES